MEKVVDFFELCLECCHKSTMSRQTLLGAGEKLEVLALNFAGTCRNINFSSASSAYMGYWPSSYFCLFMDQDGVEVHKHAKKEPSQYPAILTEQAWSIKDLLYYGFRGNFSCEKRRVVLSRQDSSILPTWVANHSAGFDSSCPLMELAI